jgi:hypothetical protein
MPRRGQLWAPESESEVFCPKVKSAWLGVLFELDFRIFTFCNLLHMTCEVEREVRNAEESIDW